jgi:hypothetical protein
MYACLFIEGKDRKREILSHHALLLSTFAFEALAL